MKLPSSIQKKFGNFAKNLDYVKTSGSFLLRKISDKNTNTIGSIQISPFPNCCGFEIVSMCQNVFCGNIEDKYLRILLELVIMWGKNRNLIYITNSEQHKLSRILDESGFHKGMSVMGTHGRYLTVWVKEAN